MQTESSNNTSRDKPSHTASWVIAVDGPSASGKGTLCRALAQHYTLSYLDTGLLYRAAAQQAASSGIDLADADQVSAFIRQQRTLDTHATDLRTEHTAALASRIATYPAVRKALFHYQRHFALHPPQGNGAVLDGRDIGTHIFPETPFKFYLFANAETRAQRRYQEMYALGLSPEFTQILTEVKARDAQDSNRQAAPLKPAHDATVIDTSALDQQQVFVQVTQKLQQSHFLSS